MSDAALAHRIEAIYRRESRRVLATLVRLLGDWDLAEDMLQEAFKAAFQQWPEEGVPANERAWLVQVGRNKGIDVLRRQSRFSDAEDLEAIAGGTEDAAQVEILADDALRLIFTCCHPALAPEVQIALTLREVCGLTTEAIASAFLVATPTMAQRIVRGKAKIKTAGIAYEVPGKKALPERLDSVLAVLYLVFNEGYKKSEGSALTRSALCQEAIRVVRLLHELLPQPEVAGLLALMLFHESRRAARFDAGGELVLLEHQDRKLWHQPTIAEAQLLAQQALTGEWVGSYALEAAIAGVHASADTYAATDWQQLLALYQLLLQANPTPVIELNAAVAEAMVYGPEIGIERITSLFERGDLANYHLAFAARGDFYRRTGQMEAACSDYHRAIALTQVEAEKRFLKARMETCR